MPADGSSSRTRRGRLISARQISTRRRSIIGKPAAAASMRAASSGLNTASRSRASAKLFANSAAKASRRNRLNTRPWLSRLWLPTMMLSNTESGRHMRERWKVRVMPAR
jgi:hypothetical protein